MPNVQRVLNGGHQNVASTSGPQKVCFVPKVSDKALSEGATEKSGIHPSKKVSDTLTSSTGTSNGQASSSGASNVGAECDATYIKVVADSVGIGGLSDVCASQIAAHTTYAIKHVLEHAKKFAVHSRRKRLTADDIDSALSMGGHPPLFGFTAKEGLPFRLAGSLGRDLFVTDERDVEITPVVNAPAAKLPLENNIKSHWLVIDGVQPAVPENPAPVEQAEAPVVVAAEKATVDTGLSLLSKAHRGLRKNEQVQIKTTSTHALSVEQQVFFKEITEAIMGSDDTRRTEALHSLQTDAGLQQLLPRFTVAIVEGVRCNIVQHNLAILIYLMRMIQSLTMNPSLSMDRCLQDLIPSVLSCILSRQLCARPETDNHWALREFSSRLLTNICKSYNICHLRARVTQVLTKVWRDESYTLTALYGSLYALNELGVDTVNAVVIPRVTQLHNDLRRLTMDKPSTVDKLAAEKLLTFVIKLLVHYVKTQKPSGLKEVVDYQNIFGGFGEAVYKAVTSDMSHTSVVPVNASASNNNVHPALHRPGSDRRPNTSNVNPQQRLVIGAKQPGSSSLSNSPLYVARPQNSPVLVRNSSLQPYVNIVGGGRFQQSTPALNRSAQQNTCFVGGGGGGGGGRAGGGGGGGTNSPTNPYVVRPSGCKKMILTATQRGTPGSTNDSFRNS